MTRVLLGLAAAAAVAIGTAPAQAQEPTAFSAGTGSADSRFVSSGGDRWRGDRHHRRQGRSRGTIGVPWGWGDGDWARYNNRTWQSDSYNDWWHDRPDRAFPRWVRNNDNCQRMWWSGGGWRC